MVLYPLTSLLALIAYGASQSSPGSAPACGKPILHSRIVGGVDSQPGEWPWQTSLQYNGLHICGGSLISDTWVVSAAHCVRTRESDLSKWTIVVGARQLSGNSANHTVTRSVVNIIVHEKYTNYSNGHDLALLQMSQPVRFSDTIQPVCLPLATHQFKYGSTCWSSGWGMINGETNLPYPQTLQKVELQLVQWRKCRCIFNLYNESNLNDIVKPGMICAGSQEGGVGTCLGDSGGPLVCNEDGTWFLAGITSFGVDSCSLPNALSVFTDVRTEADWIQGKISNAFFADQTILVTNIDDGNCTDISANQQAVCGNPVPNIPALDGPDGVLGKWPWQVSIQQNRRHLCGGILISANWVVAAAHCFIELDVTSKLTVYLGVSQLGPSIPYNLKRQAQQVILHEGYSPFFGVNDIALLELFGPVLFNDNIQPICLPYSTHQFQTGSECWTTGWATGGKNGNFLYNNNLQEMKFQLTDQMTCNCAYSLQRELYFLFLQGKMCARSQNSANGRCPGDSGGPLVCRENGTWFLAGISITDDLCTRSDRLSLFTELSNQADWIQRNILGAYFANQTIQISNDTGATNVTCTNDATQLADLKFVVVFCFLELVIVLCMLEPVILPTKLEFVVVFCFLELVIVLCMLEPVILPTKLSI